MNENRLTGYLHHMEQAATDACGFVEGLAEEDFLEDKRTQQAVIMSLIIIGEAVMKVMDGYAEFTQAHAQVPWRNMRGMRNCIMSFSVASFDAIDSVSFTWARIRRPARWIILCRGVLSGSNSHSAGHFGSVERSGARVIICSSRARQCSLYLLNALQNKSFCTIEIVHVAGAIGQASW